jgi:uncharacterized protein (TIGR03437 family)
MNKKLTIALFAAAPILVLAYSSGPPDSVSGAPGENTCAMCHGGQPNSGKGSLSIQFPGDFYVPNQTYRIKVIVADPTMVRWGFELTARSEKSTGSQAGSFASVDGMTQRITKDALQWIEHTLAGTRLGTRQSATFEFDWTAPSATAGAVVLYAAGIAGDGKDTGVGDLVYSTTLRIPLVAGAAVAPPTFGPDAVTDAWAAQSGVAPGAWITITGTELAAGEANWSPMAGHALPTTLGGVRVLVNDSPAVLSYVSATKVTFLVPASVTDGTARIVVERDGQASAPASVSVSAALPAIYSRPIPTYPSVSQAIVTTAGVGFGLQLLNSKGVVLGSSAVDPRAIRGVYPGEQIDIYAAGLGAVGPDFPTDRLPSSSLAVMAPVKVHFGDTVVAADAATLVEPGLYLVRVTVPGADALTVNYGVTPLSIEVNGIFSPSNVVLTVASSQ